MILKINMEFEVDAETEEQACDFLEERFAMENDTAENIFWDNLEEKDETFLFACVKCKKKVDEVTLDCICLECDNKPYRTLR